MPTFRSRLQQHPLVFDGAMGSMIYDRGIFINACYDELCLTQPTLIAAIHRDYVAAGADVIETNTFGANRIRLAEYGLADKVAAINTQAVRLARREIGPDGLVAGSCGPCSRAGASGPDPQAATDAIAEQARLLADAGADVIMLETFHDPDELLRAAHAAHACGLPVIASITPDAFDAEPLESVLARIEGHPAVDVVGINCHFGPAEMLPCVRRARAVLAHKPLIVMPNAGGPREIGGRSLYLNSPEYFTEYAKKYIELGVNGVGGCCGTTPAHIRMAADAIHVLSGVKTHVEIRRATPEPDGGATAATPAATPFREKSPFAAKLANGIPVTSIEILPPKQAAGLDTFLAKCQTCQAAGIDAVNLPDGPRASARMSVIATACAMRNAGLEIEPVPHCCCRDRNLIGLQSDIIGGVALGLRTWLVITGDPPKLGNYPDATGVFDVDAIGLATLCANLNRGLDAAAQPIGERQTFAFGIGVNPAAIDPEREIDRFFAKVEAGAEFAITQPIFDAEALLAFFARLGRGKPAIPIIAGLYPLLSARNATFMNEHVPGVHVPDAIIQRLQRCDTREAAAEAGIAIARDIRAALTPATAGFQVSAPLGRTDIALAVLA